MDVHTLNSTAGTEHIFREMWMGCYKDASITNPVDRIFEVFFGDYAYAMTVKQCVIACKRHRFRYAGLQV